MKVLLLPGLGGTKESKLMNVIATHLSEYDVTILDYSEEYKKKPVIKSITDFALRTRVTVDYILIGHSLGGLLALHLLNKKTRALVLLAPAIALKKETELAFLVELSVNKRFAFEGDVLVELEFEDYKKLKELQKHIKVPNIPTLVVVGEEDLIINNKYVYKFFRKIDNEKKMFIEINCGHAFVGKEELVAKIIKTFIESL